MGQKPLRFVAALHKAVRQMTLCMEERMAELEVSASEAHLLNFVDVYGPCRIGELTRVMGASKYTMTSTLDRLVERGMVTREPNPEDRRSFLARATEAGARLGEMGREGVWKLEQAIAARVTEEDIQALERVLAAVSDATQIQVRDEDKAGRAQTET